MPNPVKEARDAGYSDEEILDFLRQKDPELGNKIETAQKAQYDNSKILDFLMIQQSQTQQQPQEQQEKLSRVQKAIADLPSEPLFSTEEAISQLPTTSILQHPSIKASITDPFTRGLARSSTAILTGQGPTLEQISKQESGTLANLIGGAGELVGDLPAMTIGGTAGTSLGGPLVGGAVMFGSPQAIKSAYREYQELTQNNEKLRDKSFGEIISSIGEITKDTTIQGATGALLAMNPFLSAIKKVPGMQNILKTVTGKTAIPLATELAALEIVPTIARRALPSPEELAQSAIMLTGFRFTRNTAKKILQAAKLKAKRPEAFYKELEGLSKKDIDRIAKAKNIGEVEQILAFKAKPIKTQEQLASIAKKVRDVSEIPVSKKPKIAPETKVRVAAKEVKTTFGLPKGKTFAMKGKDEFRQPIIGKGPAPKTSDIIRQFQKDFDVPLRKGKIHPARKAKGIFKQDEGVARIKSANDVEAATHEMGHVLHSKIWKDSKAMTKDLKRYSNELPKLSYTKPDLREGFAEFTRLYVTNPGAAKQQAPRFYKFFEANIGEKFPKLKKSLLNARESYDQYLGASPEGRVFSRIDVQGDKGIVRRAGDWAKQTFNTDKLKQDFLDDVFPLKRVVADVLGIKPVEVENWNSPLNVYVAARNFKSVVRKGDIFTSHETFNIKGDKVGKPFRKILEPVKTREDLNGLRTYLVSKRALVKNKQGFRTGIRTEDAQATVNKLAKKYEPVVKEIRQYQDTLLKYVKDSGLLSEESFKKIKKANDDYVPFYRVFEADEISTSRGGRRGLQAQVPVKQFKGSTRDIVDPLESIIKNTYTMIEAAEKNLVGQQLVKLARISPKGGKYVEQIPTPLKVQKMSKEQALQSIRRDLKKTGLPEDRIDSTLSFYEKTMPKEMAIFKPSSYSPMENVLSVWFDGKRKFFQVSPELDKVWKEGISPRDSSLLTKALAVPAKTLRAGAILNPRFMQKNLVRDYLGGTVFTKNKLNPFYDPFRGFAHSMKADKTYVEWLKSGGGMATMQSIDRPKVAKRLKELMNESFLSDAKTLKDTFSSALKRGKEVIRHPVQKGLRAAAELSEEANRIAEYKAAIRNMPKELSKTRAGRDFAAFQSRDISIDFAKIGLKTRALNQIIPFWNATIQGTDKVIRTFAQNKEIGADALVRAAGSLVIPTLLLELANEGDKDIKDMTEQEKDFNFVFKAGDKIVKIPVPFEAGLIFHGLSRRFYQYFKENDPKAFEGFVNNLIQGTTPGLIPQAALPVIEAIANKDFFRDSRIIPRSQEGLISALQAKSFTSDTAKLLAKGFEYMPKLWGGERAFESKMSSPVIIEQFIKEWTGGLGSITIQIMDEILKQSGLGSDIIKPAQSPLNRFGFNAFIKRFPTAGTKSVETFYENYFKAKKLASSIKFLAKEGDVEGAKEVFKLTNGPAMDKAYQAMSNLQSMINMIYKDKDMTAQEKRIMIDRLYIQMTVFAREANKNFEQFIEARDKVKEK